MGDIKVVIAAIRRRGVETVVDRSWPFFLVGCLEG
jgi:hypothetical protein